MAENMFPVFLSSSIPEKNGELQALSWNINQHFVVALTTIAWENPSYCKLWLPQIDLFQDFADSIGITMPS